MSSFHCVSASELLSFGTISVRGGFCCFCKRFLLCDAACTSQPWYTIFSHDFEGVLGVSVPTAPLELGEMAAGGVPRCTGGVEVMIAKGFDEVRKKL